MAKKTTYTIKKLESGEKYEFRVRAKNEAGLSVGGAELVEPLIIQTGLLLNMNRNFTVKFM